MSDLGNTSNQTSDPSRPAFFERVDKIYKTHYDSSNVHAIGRTAVTGGKLVALPLQDGSTAQLSLGTRTVEGFGDPVFVEELDIDILSAEDQTRGLFFRLYNTNSGLIEWGMGHQSGGILNAKRHAQIIENLRSIISQLETES